MTTPLGLLAYTKLPQSNCIANVEQEVVNYRLRTAQSLQSNAGSSTLSTQLLNGPLPRTALQSQVSFVLVLIKERFFFATKEDRDDEIQTVIEQKFISNYILSSTLSILYYYYYNYYITLLLYSKVEYSI